MGKTAELGATFIKNKKITANNVSVIYDSVSQHGREIVEYNEEVQSFYRIMTHYVPMLGMIPEDQRYIELKRNLFEFVMKNTEYTKVSLNMYSWLLFIYLFYHKCVSNFEINNIPLTQNIPVANLQLWAASTLQKQNKGFGAWLDEMQKDTSEPDGLAVVFMSHYLR